MSGQNTRLDWVDAAKGISIILVVMMYSVFNVGEHTEGVGLLHHAIGFATPFRMPEFFLISGLFLGHVIARDWLRYADRRVVHYFYFYALWAVIHLVVKVGLASGDPLLAAQNMAWAIIEPYGVLWFIYLLAAFSAATKLLYELRVPHWAAVAIGAVLQMASISTGSYLIDQFSEYFVYFYVGYAFAPQIFRLVDWAQAHRAVAAAGLAVYAALNALLVFSPGYEVLAGEIHIGLAGLPGIRLGLAIVGSLALCVAAGLLVQLPWMAWLSRLGQRSLVIYLAFVLPMSFIRIALDKVGIISDVTLVSLIVLVGSIAAPLALYFLVQRTGYGRFLFERPAWAHLPGTPGSRSDARRPLAVPAE